MKLCRAMAVARLVGMTTHYGRGGRSEARGTRPTHLASSLGSGHFRSPHATRSLLPMRPGCLRFCTGHLEESQLWRWLWETEAQRDTDYTQSQAALGPEP